MSTILKYTIKTVVFAFTLILLTLIYGELQDINTHLNHIDHWSDMSDVDPN